MPSSLIFSLIKPSGPTKVIDKLGNSFKAIETPKIIVSGPLSLPKASMTILYCFSIMLYVLFHKGYYSIFMIYK